MRPPDEGTLPPEGSSRGVPPRIGATLLELRNALMRAKKCRRLLERQDFARERWMEIVGELDPELRFMVRGRGRILDVIVVRLEGAGKPVKRGTLARELAQQRVGTAERIRQSITLGLRTGTLALFPRKSIGLGEWKEPKG